MNRILVICVVLAAVFSAGAPVQAEEYYRFDFWSSSEPFVSLNQAVQIADNATVFTNNRILELGTGWPVILGLWVKTFTLDFSSPRSGRMRRHTRAYSPCTGSIPETRGSTGPSTMSQPLRFRT